MQTPAPDTAPGHYYVTCFDGGRTAILAGPFRDDHARALSLVETVRRIAEERDPRAHFYAFGTARFGYDFARSGSLNAELREAEERAAFCAMIDGKK